MKNIRYLFLVTFGMAANCIAAPIITLSPSYSKVETGESFTVNVLLGGIQASDALLAFGFDVSNMSELSYNGATIGAAFSDDSSAFSSTDVAGSAFPPVFGDNILLSTLAFTAGSVEGVWGISVLTDLEFRFSEGLFTEYDIYDVAGSTSIEVVSQVPLPAALWLFGSGLLMIAGYAKKGTIK